MAINQKTSILTYDKKKRFISHWNVNHALPAS